MKEEAVYKAEILKEYRKIAQDNVAQKISFYKKNESFFNKVPLNEKLEIVLDFQKALFQNRHFNEYLGRCDDLLSKLFDSQLFPIFRKDAVQSLLFHKAGCLLNLHRLEESEEAMKSLVQIDKNKSQLYKGLLFQLFKSKRLLLKFQARGLVIALILTSAILSVYSALMIKPYYPASFLSFKAWTIGIFILGIAIWGSFIAYNYFRSHKEASDFIKKYRTSTALESTEW